MRALPLAGLLFYIWIPKDEDVIAWMMRQIFLFLQLLHVRDYRCNQRPRTILRKERIHIASQTSYTLYDRLPPIPQEPPPDESSQ